LAQDNPLHISLFRPHQNEFLEMSFLLNSCLDIFEIRQNNKTIEQDLGLLQAVDERLATYGWLTNTGIKFIIVVDMAGKPPAPGDDDRKKAALVLGLRDSDLKPVCEMYYGFEECAHFPAPGIPCSANCIHSAPAESFLFSR
jgi:trafficking protein particle complex subunit 2